MTPGRLRLAAGVGLLVAAACGDGPTDPPLPELEIIPTAGQGEFGVVGQELRLEALVRRRSDGRPRAGVEVSWRVEAGDATLAPSASTSVSDEDGSVAVQLRLGETAGPVAVRVTALEQEEATARFGLTAGAHPRLDRVSPTSVAAGAVVTLEGAGFSPDPADDVVLFSGIRGEVTAATRERLDVRVPPCLPTGPVVATVQLGVLVSEGVPVTVEGPGDGATVLEPGGWLDVVEPAEPGCLRLPGGSRYLLVASSSSTLAGGRWPVTLRGLSGGAPVASPRHGPDRGLVTGPREEGSGPAPGGGVAWRWEKALRRREAGMAARIRRPGVPPAPPEAAARGLTGIPDVGDRRSFRVHAGEAGTEEVTAVARYVGERAVLYVDEGAPGPGFDDDDLALLARRFDDAIHPTVTGAFGAVSDLDGNQRVIILFTPVVNRLSPPGSEGFVGGFFYGLDLLEGKGGNDGEVFYALVPDPGGVHADPRSVERVVEAVPAVLAHEFQHMVHFYQRVLLRGGEGTGALWLSEGLAQMAEELVARHYRSRGEPGAAELFRVGNRSRARSYLEDPARVSLVIGSGQGTLPERGGGWLFTLYLADRWGGGILGELARTTRTGVENVTAVTGASWPGLLADFWAALHLDGAGGYAFEYPGVALRTLLDAGGGAPWPLEPVRPGESDFHRADTLWSASARHYIVEPWEGAPLVLRLAGRAGGPAPPGSELALRVVRLF